MCDRDNRTCATPMECCHGVCIYRACTSFVHVEWDWITRGLALLLAAFLCWVCYDVACDRSRMRVVAPFPAHDDDARPCGAVAPTAEIVVEDADEKDVKDGNDRPEEDVLPSYAEVASQAKGADSA